MLEHSSQILRGGEWLKKKIFLSSDLYMKMKKSMKQKKSETIEM